MMPDFSCSIELITQPKFGVKYGACGFASFMFLFSMGATDALAVSATGHVNVHILETLSLAEVKEVDYGSLVNEDGICTINASGSLEGSGGSSCSGQGQLGEFVISGTENQAIDIEVSSGESISGVTFTPELHSSSTAILVGGTTTALIGGVLNLDNATEGSHALSYVISINYN